MRSPFASCAPARLDGAPAGTSAAGVAGRVRVRRIRALARAAAKPGGFRNGHRPGPRPGALMSPQLLPVAGYAGCPGRGGRDRRARRVGRRRAARRRHGESGGAHRHGALRPCQGAGRFSAGDRDPDADGGAPAGRAGHLNRSVQGVDPVAQPVQPGTATGIGAADPVVGHLHLKCPAGAREADAPPRRPGRAAPCS